MTGEGLREILNPSELLINQQPPDLSGSAIAANVEGIRPILIEVQALVSSAVYGTPQRTSTGFDTRRLSMLLAVLEKRASFKLASHRDYRKKSVFSRPIMVPPRLRPNLKGLLATWVRPALISSQARFSG